MRRFLSTPGPRIAAIASRQHGVITVAQLREAGLGEASVRRQVAAGRLHRLHRGVYAVGHRSLSWRGRWLAAVLAVGDGAILSHTSAAALWGFLRPIGGPAHVTVAASRRPGPRRGIVVHRSRSLDPSPVTPGGGTASGGLEAPVTGDVGNASGGPGAGHVTNPGRGVVTRRHGIAVTTPARTIADIRGTVEPYLFRRALRQAELAGYRVPHLATTGRTRSDLELLFLALCDAHGVPRPEVNVRVAGRLVDFLFRDHRLVVETDSWDYHRGSVAFEDDHERDLALHACGFSVRRYTGEQVEAAPDAVAVDLRGAVGISCGR